MFEAIWQFVQDAATHMQAQPQVEVHSAFLGIAAALLISAGISAGSSLLGGWMNAKENSKAAKAAADADSEKLEWQKGVDRFNAVEERRMNDHAITQDSVNQLNNALQTNVALKNRVVSMWGRGRMQ